MKKLHPLWIIVCAVVFLFSKPHMVFSDPPDMDEERLMPPKTQVSEIQQEKSPAKQDAQQDAAPDNGRSVTKEIKYVPGPDGKWFTPDDAIYDFTLYDYDAKGRLMRRKSYNVEKDTNATPADERLKEYWAYKYDDDGKMVKEMYYSSKGMNNKWFTSQDEVTYHTDYEYDSLGRKIQALKHIADNAAHYIRYEYDAKGRLSKDIEYRNSGVDGEWFTADDEIEKYHTYEYNKQGVLIKNAEYHADHNGRGPDGHWFTADDCISSAKLCVYYGNSAMQRMTKKFIDKGPDNLWFTDDDIIQYYIVYFYADKKP